ncbi:MAG TPA: cell wall hydrolase [Paracoccaceae bacterium]|nr:cell wall hydrolase [Paracoccaceae bacterium]
MPTRRPGPRHAGLRALLLFAAMLAPMAEATADATGEEAAYRGALADALTGELAALSAFAARDGLGEDGVDRIDPWQDVVARKERSSLAAIRALHSQDVEVSRRIGGMQDLMTTEQLLASLGDKLNADALDRVEVGERSEDWRCLAEAMYFEARGEGLAGQLAVAEVILNRVEATQYPDTVCDVVLQGAADGGACQFSYNCDGTANRIGNERVWKRIGKVAWLMLQGRPRTLTDEALYFHSTSVRPSWSRKFLRTAQIGRHVFYRPKVRVSLN